MPRELESWADSLLVRVNQPMASGIPGNFNAVLIETATASNVLIGLQRGPSFPRHGQVPYEKGGLITIGTTKLDFEHSGSIGEGVDKSVEQVEREFLNVRFRRRR